MSADTPRPATTVRTTVCSRCPGCGRQISPDWAIGAPDPAAGRLVANRATDDHGNAVIVATGCLEFSGIGASNAHAMPGVAGFAPAPAAVVPRGAAGLVGTVRAHAETIRPTRSPSPSRGRNRVSLQR